MAYFGRAGVEIKVSEAPRPILLPAPRAACSYQGGFPKEERCSAGSGP